MKLLLNKKKGKASTNKDGYIGVGLGNHVKKFSNRSEQHLVDVYQVYLDEKDASDKYRLIFTINPVCTNALFNAITEITYKEGSEECYCLPNTDALAPDKLTYPNIISNQPITRLQAIRDTEYSNENIYGLTYLPGIDLFNNHLMRQNGFNCVMKRTGRDCLRDGKIWHLKENSDILDITGATENITDVFNTIRDYQRTRDGKRIDKTFPGLDATYLNPTTGEPHIYQEAEILSFDTTIKERLKEKNGWFGFYNPSTLEIPVAKYKDENGKVDNEIDIYINRLLNDRNACDFIEMFPDRSRFTFVPQKNKYRRNRLEKNWEYCLTYPYLSTQEMINKDGTPVLAEGNETVLNPVVAERDSAGNVRNGLAFSVIEEFVTDGDKQRILFQATNSIHNLAPKDTINFYYPANDNGEYDASGGTFTGVFSVQVTGIGDKNGELQQYYFTIDHEDAPKGWFDEDGRLKNEMKIKGRFCKTVFGVECMYYFRVFRRLPNFNEISKDENRAYYIGKYNAPKYDFKSEINKLAFANNIYGDNIVQILYLDDIDVNGLTDNLERPVSDIYLTIVKANNGHEKWYPETGTAKYSDEDITIARAFGKVTSGIDLPPEDGFMRNYNVHRIHNIDFQKVCETYGSGFTRPYENLGNIDKNYNLDGNRESTNDNDRCLDKNLIKPLETLEDDVTIDQEFFLGDMVEFSLSQYQETILEPVYHRFNTAQREYVSEDYKDIVIDEIYMDDYEGSETAITQNTGETIDGNFKCVETTYNRGFDTSDETTTANTKALITYPGNLFPEGYYYQPHYRVHLKDISDRVSQSSDTLVKLTEDGVETGETESEVSFTTALDYDIIAKDEIVIQDTKNNIFYDAIVTNVTGVTGETRVEAALKDGRKINEGLNDDEKPKSFLVFKKTLGIPKYAMHYPDTGGKYVWRALVPHSKVSSDSEIYDKPFANGAHYRHLGINFFLRRQDPLGYYELNTKTMYSTGEVNKLNNFMVQGRANENIYYDVTINANLLDIC